MAKEELHCAKCQAVVTDDDIFCPNCGAAFKAIPPDYVPPEPPPMPHNINGIHYNIVILITSLAASFTLAYILTNNNPESGNLFVYFGIIFAIAEIFLYIYLLPSIIAIENNNQNLFLIYVLNLLLGGTIIGWFVALVMAISSNQK